MNTIYVILLALLMIPLMENDAFLAAFGFYHENYFILLFLYVHLYYYTLDITMRIFINWSSRVFEFQADEYAVRVGLGMSSYNALVRNFA